MKSRKDPSAVDLIEEAVHLLRTSTPAVTTRYFLGSLPFFLAFLYFWAEMASSPTAELDLPFLALAMGLLFAWMKAWHVSFCEGLLSRLRGETAVPPSPGGLFHSATQMLALYPSYFLALPFSVALFFPVAWVYAFYQNLTGLGELRCYGLGRRLHRAAALARLWPRQNHVILLVLLPLSIFIFLNLFLALLTVPTLAKTLLGIESSWTRGGWNPLNATLLMTVGTLSALVMGLLVKTVYTLRCFYGDALETGIDLRADLRRMRLNPKRLGLNVLFLVASLAAVPNRVLEAAPEQAAESGSALQIDPDELDQTILEVLNRREFQWRFPREDVLEAVDKGGLHSILSSLIERAREAYRIVSGSIGKLLEWIERMLSSIRPGSAQPVSSEGTWSERLNQVTIAAVITLLIGAVLLVIRFYRRDPKVQTEQTAGELEPIVAEREDGLSAATRTPDRWIEEAERLAGMGDLQGALRALFLSTLATLAARGLIRLERHKSNRDYLFELSRSAAGRDELFALFSESTHWFERAWYGGHPVIAQQLERFDANRRRIDSLVTA